MREQIENELRERRIFNRINSLVEEGVITHEEVASAGILILCECGAVSQIDAEVCSGCGGRLE